MVQFKTVQITDLTDEDLEAMAHQGQLIDVRETDEYEAGHIDGAQSYPLSSLNTNSRSTKARPTTFIAKPANAANKPARC